MVSRSDIASFLRRHDLGGVVCLHASYKALGPVDGGPLALVDAFLDHGCTLLVPSFYYAAEAPSPGGGYKTNGLGTQPPGPPTNYEHRSDQVDPSMGVVSRTIVAHARARRTRNPHDSFAALGPLADVLVEGADLLNVYSPYKAIVSRGLRAHVVLVGVDFSSCTPLHFAEERAGRLLFRRWALCEGRVVEVEVGSCSEGFENLRPATRSLESVDTLGTSAVRIYPFVPLVDTVADVLRVTPKAGRCADPDCPRCRDMVAGGRGRVVG